MYKRVKKPKLGRKSSHKNLLIRNLLRSLFTNGYLTTTTVKAKALKQEAQKLLNALKKNSDMVTLKNASVTVGSRELVQKIVKYAQENEPKVKTVKIGYRDGDKAQTTRISVVGYAVKKAKKVVKEEKKEEKVEQKVVEPKIGEPKRSVGKAIKETFAGRKERARTRSGI